MYELHVINYSYIKNPIVCPITEAGMGRGVKKGGRLAAPECASCII